MKFLGKNSPNSKNRNKHKRTAVLAIKTFFSVSANNFNETDLGVDTSKMFAYATVVFVDPNSADHLF